MKIRGLSAANLDRLNLLALAAFIIFVVINLVYKVDSPDRIEFEIAIALTVIVLTAVVIWGWGRAFLGKGWRSLRQANLTVDLLHSLALLLAVAAFILHCWGDLGKVTELPLEYSPIVVAAFAGLYTALHSALRSRLEEGVGFNLKGMLGPVDLVKQNGGGDQAVSIEQVDPAKLQPRDLIQLKAGDYLPCDGRVIWGRAVVEERRYSGYTVVKTKGPEGSVYAGSRVISGTVQLEVENPLDDSILSGFISEFEKRLHQVDQASQTVSRLYRFCHWLLLGLAIVAAVLFVLRGQELVSVFQAAAAVLMLAPILVVFDVSLLIRQLLFSAAFRRGILLEGVESLSLLHRVRNLVIDYQAAYPPGRPEVTGYDLIDRRVDRSALDRLLFTFFSQSDEELHRAATRYLQDKVELESFSFPDLQDCQIYPGQGLVGTLDGVRLIIGSEPFLVQQGVQVEVSDLFEERDGQTALYIAVKDAIIARMQLGTSFGSDGATLVEKLRQLRIRTVIISQDSSDNIDKLGKQIGLELSDIHAGLTKLQMQETVGKISDACLYAQPETDQLLLKESFLTMVVFDPVRFEVATRFSTVFTRDLEIVSETLKSVKKSWPLLNNYLYYAAAVSGLSLGFALAVGVAPAVTAAIGSAVAFLTWSKLLSLVVKF